MTYDNGLEHGREALDRARALGLPDETTMFFAVDFDALDPDIDGGVMDYFRGVRDAMSWAIERQLKVGVYGTRNVCQKVIDAGLASAAFVTGMSTGYSGNMGFRTPDEWHYNQITELSVDLAGTPIGIDKNVVASRAAAVDLAKILPPPIERDGSTTGTGYDALFEWVSRAEIECEKALTEAHTFLHPTRLASADIRDTIAHVLRMPTYWGGLMWPLYTPRLITDEIRTIAQAAMLGALAGMNPPKPESNRDVAHFAATYLGYKMWGTPPHVDDYGLGDLGGWALDLLQAWGYYKRADSPGSLHSWMVANIGGPDDQGFGYADVVADADAFLIAHDWYTSGSKPLSESLRQVLQRGPAERIGQFYQLRFAGQADNVARAYSRLITGQGVLDPIPLSERALRQAAGLRDGDPMPTQAEALTCGRAFAEKLVSMGA